MAKTGEDPIRAIKVFLSRARRRSTARIVSQLREVYRRVDKARRLHPGVGMSEALERLRAL